MYTLNVSLIPLALMGVVQSQVIAAGYNIWEDSSAGWQSSFPQTQGVIDSFANSYVGDVAASALAMKKAEIDLLAAETRVAVSKKMQPFATPDEKASWGIKAGQAKAYLDSVALGVPDESLCPLIAAIASVSGKTVQAEAEKINGNALALQSAEALIAGNVSKLKAQAEDAAAAATDLAGVAAIMLIDISAGWPS